MKRTTAFARRYQRAMGYSVLGDCDVCGGETAFTVRESTGEPYEYLLLLACPPRTRKECVRTLLMDALSRGVRLLVDKKGLR